MWKWIFGFAMVVIEAYLRAQGELEARNTCVRQPLRWFKRRKNPIEKIFSQKKVTASQTWTDFGNFTIWARFHPKCWWFLMKKWSKCEKSKFHRKNAFEDDFKAPESSKVVSQHHTSKLRKTKIFDFSLGFPLFWLPEPVIFNDLVDFENFRMKKKSVQRFPKSWSNIIKNPFRTR